MSEMSTPQAPQPVAEPANTEAPTITLRGQKYTARNYNLQKDFAEAEEYLRSTRKDPISAILPALDAYKDNPQIQKQLLDRAYQDLRRQNDGDRLPEREVATWLDSIEGFAFTCWQILRDGNPELKEREAVRTLMWETIAKEGDRKTLERLKKERDATVAPQ